MSHAVGHIEILPDQLALGVPRGGVDVTEAATVPGKGSFAGRVPLSGGSTPKTLYGLLASDDFRDRFPWQRVSWFWGDERFVLRYDHPESNFRMAREADAPARHRPRCRQRNIHPYTAPTGTPGRRGGSPLRTDTAADLTVRQPSIRGTGRSSTL